MKEQQLAKKKEKKTKKAKKRASVKKEQITESGLFTWIGSELILTL